MTKKKPQQKADYDVGYGKPPKHGQIRPGEVRNPHGRNGKRAKDEDDFEKVMARKTRVSIDGETILLSTSEAFYMKMAALALSGKVGAARIVQEELHRRWKASPASPSAAEQAKEKEEQELKEQLSKRLVQLLEDKAAAKKAEGDASREGEADPRKREQAEPSDDKQP